VIIHAPISILFVDKNDGSSHRFILSYLQSMPHVSLDITRDLPHDLDSLQVVITVKSDGFAGHFHSLESFVQSGGGWLGVDYGVQGPLPEAFGARASSIGPAAELRILFQDYNCPMAQRLPKAIFAKGRYRALEATEQDTETVLYADWRYAHSPVLVRRPFGRGHTACTTLEDDSHPVLRQILYRLIRELGGRPIKRKTLGVGLLGYSPFVGQEHGQGVMSTDGLYLRGICDLNPERLDQAENDFQGIKTYPSVASFAQSPDIDLVIVCTPPNTHAPLSLQMMASGKHVLCEKPLALSHKEAAAMAEMAEKERLHMSCHQNRRWDADYLAIKQALLEGLIGELFYLETFVGGFSHPCGYWHSHQEISGGAAYDWGGHYLDWVVGLMPFQVVSVVCTSHKRVWHDITNADQERIQLRFAGGQEAEFLHSDICALRKPKWYLLGTQGAIIGRWQDVVQYELDPIVYFREHHIPATEMLPKLTLHRRHSSGRVVAQELMIPERRPFSLYRNLADHLLTGEPNEVPVEQSVLVVDILEAAARSASKGGSVEILNG
jgi:predicted dehydrogenase